MRKRGFIIVGAVLFLFVLLGPVFNVSHATEDKFGGLGLKVAQIYDPETENHMGSLVVLDVLEGTPAWESAIQKGDVITHIDGEPTEGKMFGYLILEKLRGEIGSKVNITVERSNIQTPLDFSLTRIEIVYSNEQKE